MTDYTRTTIKLPQEVALSLDQQLTRQHKVKIKTTLINHIHACFVYSTKHFHQKRVTAKSRDLVSALFKG